jgi:hypothetical protein
LGPSSRHYPGGVRIRSREAIAAFLAETHSELRDIVGRSLDDYRSGQFDPAFTGMLLAIRRGLIEEVAAAD